MRLAAARLLAALLPAASLGPAALAPPVLAQDLAQDFQRIAPSQPPANPPARAVPLPAPGEPGPGGSAVLLPALKGLLFVPKAADVKSTGVDAPGIGMPGNPLLDTPEFRAKLAPYLGQPVTLDRLNAITHLAVEEFRAHDHPLVDVALPPQDISSGTVQIVALEFTANSVRIEGNQWFSTGLLRPEIRLAPGDTIDAKRLTADLDWLNDNPFRQATVAYQAAKTVGQTDVVIQVKDRFPVRVFGGFANNGTQTTDRNRLNAGFDWGNAFWLGHQLSYQFTTSPDLAKFNAHSVVYQVPLPWRDKLTVFGSYSSTVPALGNDLGQTATSWQVSGRYQVTLPNLDKMTQRVSAGYDFKRSNSNLSFDGESVLTGLSDIDQIVLAYSGDRPDALGSTSAALTAYLSPGGLSAFNADRAFRPTSTQSGRAFAQAEYAYVTLGLDRSTKLPADLTLANRLVAQWSTANLLASEQLGFGGAASVRGYDERAVNGDRGLLLSNEVRSPPFHLLSHLGYAEPQDSLVLLAFWDYGISSLRRPAEGDKPTTYLSGTGVGLRYDIAPNAQLSLDWGFPLIGLGQPGGRRSHVYVAFTMSY